MKNFFLLIVFGFALLMAGCADKTQTAADPPGEVSYVQTADLQQAAASIALDAPVHLVQDPASDPPAVSDKTFADLLKANWMAVLVGLLGFVDVIVRLTPTEKDNSLLNKLYKILDFLIPNFKSGGGKFTPEQNE